MTVRVTWKQALASRMERHLLDPIGTMPVASAVDRLCGVHTQASSFPSPAPLGNTRTYQALPVTWRTICTWTKTWAMTETTPIPSPEWPLTIGSASLTRSSPTPHHCQPNARHRSPPARAVGPPRRERRIR